MMNDSMRNDADRIIKEALRAVAPDEAVKNALSKVKLTGQVVLVAIGKAAWQMAKAAKDTLADRIDRGIVITKYHHVKGSLDGLEMREAGHPIPDENSFAATQAALDKVRGLTSEDTVLFLVSGGGSALFEKPLVTSAELADLNAQLLASGASITEMNTVRKRLSGVKGGRFAELCRPARVISVILSDIIGDPLDMIASGPAYPDRSTCAEAMAIVNRYALRLSPEAQRMMQVETVKKLENVVTYVTGSVRELCSAAARACKALEYEPLLLTDQLCCEAREAGSFLGAILRSHRGDGRRIAFIAGGETIVHLRGDGKGGRNQELALSAAQELAGLTDVAVFSVGSDGTDGPTTAAGGYVDGGTVQRLSEQGLSVADSLARNDSYTALNAVDGLIVTGPTGTNVNDVTVGLLR